MAILNRAIWAAKSAKRAISISDTKRAIEKLFELIARHLADGDEVNLAGFGKLTVAGRAARQGRNPRPARRFRSPLPRRPSSRPPVP
ncbi:MAG: HU family DNA-binding protein [Solirubrobacteraceae bacterium]|jgi:DNA-binding protein HU-beta